MRMSLEDQNVKLLILPIFEFHEWLEMKSMWKKLEKKMQPEKEGLSESKGILANFT